MRYKFVISALFMCFFMELSAQSTLISDDPRVEQRLRSIQSEDGAVIVVQDGIDNTASLDIQASRQNAMQIQLSQSGNQNNADVDLSSSSGDLIIVQEGNDNNTSLDNVRFSESALDIIQVGEGNNIIQRDAELINSGTEIYQEGTDHNIEIESNLEIEGMRISQYGNGANIRISNQ